MWEMKKIKPIYDHDHETSSVEKRNGSPLKSQIRFSRKLFGCIKRNDTAELQSLLDNSDSDNVKLPINSPFQHLAEGRGKVSSENLVYKLNVRYPLSVAVYYESFDCFVALVKNGANIFLQDHAGNNLVHLLIYAHRHSESDVFLKCYDVVLSEAKTVAEREKLLTRRNDEGLTPLELSVKLCCLPMFKAILYTEGVHRTNVRGEGTVLTSRYTFANHVHEPEVMSRSFLWQLVWLEETAESARMMKAVLNVPPIKKLLQNRFEAVLPHISVWILTRVLLVVVYLLLDLHLDGRYLEFACWPHNNSLKNIVFDETFAEMLSETFQNSSLPAEVWTNTVYGTAYSLCTFVTLGLEIGFLAKYTDIFTRARFRTLFRSSVVNTNFYQVNAILLAFNFVSGSMFAAQLTTNHSDPNSLGQGMSIMNMNEGIFLTFSVMYFLQIIPQGGFFVIGFQKMLTTLAAFALLQFTIIFVFATIFRHINVYFCDPGPHSCRYFDSVYQTFLIMLNMRQVTRGSQCRGAGNALLKATHIIYTFVVAILTVNYLIAVMSSVYQIFTDATQAVVQIHRVHMFLVIERRLSIFRRIMPSKMKVPDTVTIVLQELDEETEGLKNLRLEQDQDDNEIDVQL